VRWLVAQGEGQFLEFKPGPTRPSELATELAAFANADGGQLLLGVLEHSPDDAEIVGVANRKVTIDHLYTAAVLCSPKLELTRPEEVDVDGRLVVVATVPAGLHQVFSADGRYVLREGSYCRTLDAPEIRTLMSRRGLLVFDAEPVRGATRAHLDRALVRAYVGRYRSGERMSTDALLLARGLLVRPGGDPEAVPVPSVAGLLLLGKIPQQFFPQARVAVVQYAGTEMGESFLKREIEGPLATQLEEAVAWLSRTTLHAVHLRGKDRSDREEYPREALREAILNALTHRDYSLTGDRIRVMLYADRVEVFSPGRLGGPMRMDTLLLGRWSRNPTLVHGLVALDLMEEVGFGLNRMIAAMHSAGLPPPVFREVGETFMVTLYGPGPSLLHDGTTDRERPRTAVAQAALSQDERQAWLLQHLRTIGPLTPRAYAEAVTVSMDTAQRDLRDLVQRGLIQAQGTTRDRRYVLAD